MPTVDGMLFGSEPKAILANHLIAWQTVGRTVRGGEEHDEH
ncbi:hypothetical protein [Nocardia sp. NBC_01329]|nr:hypothetical protein OG405_09260 [Nocardia sp. NBC_01329]